MESEVKLRFNQSDEMDRTVSAPWLRLYLKSDIPERQSLNNAYFDTDDFLLRSVRAVARVRNINDAKFVHTVKISAGQVNGLHQRLEWNCDVESPVFDPSSFLQFIQEPCDDREQLERVLVPIINSKTKCIFETVFDRDIYIAQYGESQIEIALDKGEVRAAHQIDRICEMELELISGKLSDLLSLSRIVREHSDCEIESISKFGRAVMLLDKETSK